VTRTVVHVVTGAPRTGKSALIARLLASRPLWAGLAPRACPCCIGRVETQVLLTRLLREQRPKRVLLELGELRHLVALHRALGVWPLSQYVEVGRSIQLPQDEALVPEMLGA